MQSKLDETIPKPKKYVDYPNTNNYVVATSRYSNPTLGAHVTDMFKFRNGWDEEMTPSLDQLTQRKQAILTQLDKYVEDCKPIAEQNKLIEEHNQTVRYKVGNIMKELGVPSNLHHF